jgi:chromosome segregation ATPase
LSDLQSQLQTANHQIQDTEHLKQEYTNKIKDLEGRLQDLAEENKRLVHALNKSQHEVTEMRSECLKYHDMEKQLKNALEEND